ncbi:MAG TPA: 50S ribosomal protein L11 methyltransferase, partial [Blastocatellia bacterium]|nr:50S ribosomal protein L11 methyltransferase [Blastocatellia bacterium]
MKKQSLPVNDRRASPNSWRLLTIRLPLAHEEAASVLLFELGSTGIVTLAETTEIVELGAYFENHIQVDEITTQVEELFAGLDSIQMSLSEVANQDWMQKWKEGFEPFEVGERL